ncbi:MAG: hypothetical protein HY645_13445 [Acidobacteria bacterium]|nr:hypothetical protein [Acidobacteriota bacterium]
MKKWLFLPVLTLCSLPVHGAIEEKYQFDQPPYSVEIDTARHIAVLQVGDESIALFDLKERRTLATVAVAKAGDTVRQTLLNPVDSTTVAILRRNTLGVLNLESLQVSTTDIVLPFEFSNYISWVAPNFNTLLAVADEGIFRGPDVGFVRRHAIVSLNSGKIELIKELQYGRIVSDGRSALLAFQGRQPKIDILNQRTLEKEAEVAVTGDYSVSHVLGEPWLLIGLGPKGELSIIDLAKRTETFKTKLDNIRLLRGSALDDSRGLLYLLAEPEDSESAELIVWEIASRSIARKLKLSFRADELAGFSPLVRSLDVDSSESLAVISRPDSKSITLLELPIGFDLNFAHSVDGQNVRSVFHVANPSEVKTATFGFTFHDSNGLVLQPAPVTPSEGLTLEPLGSRVVSTAGTGPDIRVGSVRISSNVDLAATLIYDLPRFGEVGVGESTALRKFIVPVERSETKNANSGLAVANYSAASNKVILELRSPSGSVVLSKEITLPPNGQSAKFLNEIFPEAQTNEFVGSITASATFPIGAVALRLRGNSLTTLPVKEVR